MTLMNGKIKAGILITMGLNIAALAPGADSKGIVYDFKENFDAGRLKTEHAAVSVIPSDEGGGLGIELLSSEVEPTVTFNLPEESRDLSAFRYVEMDILNLSEKEAVLTFWALSGAGWGGMNSAAETQAGREKLEPHSAATLKIDLYGRYPGPDALATAIDPSTVKQLEIVFHIRQASLRFAIDHIRVAGRRPPHSLGTAARFPVPEVTSGPPAPGKRVRQQLPAYQGTRIAHVLCLPDNWRPDGLYPIIVEFTGNVFYHKFCHSTGRTEQGHLAYGLSRGKDFICINMPFVSEDGLHEQVNGWGSEEKTIDYCIETLRYVCENFRGDPSAIFITGFSRGDIACNYIALRDDRIADVWLGFLSDPGYKWPGGRGWKDSGIGWDERAQRIRGRSCFTSRPDLGPAHVDIQYLEDSPTTLAARKWLREVLETRPGTHSIRGRVIGQDGRGIGGVRIEGGETHFTWTDENGNYVLKSLIDGPRTITASGKGLTFEPPQCTLVLNGSDAAGVDFTAISEGPVAGEIDFRRLPASGIKIMPDLSRMPDKDGILGSMELKVPAFQKGCFYSDRKTFNSWHGGGNQIAPRIFGKTFGELNSRQYAYRAAFILFELQDGNFLALLPVSGRQTMSWAQADGENNLWLYFGTLGTQPVRGDVPLFAWSIAPDLYEACRQAWEAAITCELLGGSTDFRYKKQYPEPLKYLGWCSWEEYKKDINCRLLQDTAKQIEESGLPIRYMLIDDGHQQGVAQDCRLQSFAPDPEKFPQGWKPLLEMRKEDKVRWMGLWHGFSGLQNTIHLENDFGALNDHLMRVTRPDGCPGQVPKDNPVSSQAFYDALIGSVKYYGFDFTKIDYQMRDLEWYIGTDNAVAASVANLQSMEQAAHRDLKGLINCMAHNNICIFNTRYSAVTRCSVDYKVGNADKGREHIWQSFHNTLWQCQTVWGDHDMFHSCDPYGGRMMAVSKALSGGPVYLSDAPKDFIADYIRPLCYEDGLLLRPLAPAAPLPDSVFTDPIKKPQAYRVIAPLEGGAAAVAAYHLAAGEMSVHGVVSPKDYQHAGAMIQPYAGRWTEPAEGLVVYDWYEGAGRRLDTEYRFDLTGFSDRLLLLCPIRNGWAVIGRTDKYLSPAAVQIAESTNRRLSIYMREAGPLVVYSEKGRPQAEGIQGKDLGENFYRFDIPAKSGDGIWNITR